MQGLLLDTHAVLWWLSGDSRFPNATRSAIEDSGLDVYISTATIWEIAIKVGLGKLRADDDLPEQLAAGSFRLLPVSADHAWRVRELPRHHNDPFDRMLVAQAMAERLSLVTADPAFARYQGVHAIWN